MSSGILVTVCVYGTLWVLGFIPGVKEIAESVLSPFRQIIGQHIEYMCANSPTDAFCRSLGFGIHQMCQTAYFNDLACTIVPCIAAFLFIRTFSRPGKLLLTAKGIQLSWALPFEFRGPLIPWSAINRVSFKRPTGTTTQSNSLIAFECDKLPFIYSLTESVSAASKGNICLRLGNIESDNDRETLSRILQENAQAVDATVLESLTPAQNQSYTELWLGALTAPSKRERAEPLRSGMQLSSGRFEIVGKLGVGGQGTAYLARSSSVATSKPQTTTDDDADADKAHEDLQDSADIVLKEFVLPLYVDTDSRKNVLEKFVKEADILKKLDNPHIVKLMDCFIEDHRGYMVLERINGKTLRDLVLSEGPMTELRVSSLLHQMCEMLQYLHSQSPPVVHRDFAPDNLILSEDGTLKLVDFNVAQQSEGAFTGTIVGKQSYVPPEQLRGMATPQSDIYALGATLYFLLTGENAEPLSVSHPREKVANVSEQMDELVARCTQLEEETRFKSASEIANSMRIAIPLAEEVEKQKR